MTLHVCLACGRGEADVPLVVLTHRGVPRWICPQCLPTLIHQPERLEGKLGAADTSGGTTQR